MNDEELQEVVAHGVVGVGAGGSCGNTQELHIITNNKAIKSQTKRSGSRQLKKSTTR